MEPIEIERHWSFSQALDFAWKRYVGIGISSRGYRNRVLLSWGALVGRRSALDQREAFIRASGGIEDAARLIGVESSGVSRLRTAFRKLKEGSAGVVWVASGDELVGSFESYQVLERIGKGGTSDVYKVRGMSTGKLFAAKVLHGERFEINPETRARFKREIELSKSVSAPGLVRTMDACEWGDSVVAVMEYVPGPSLKRRVETNLPTETEILKWMESLAEGLCDLHRLQILHRDISPKNILFRTDGSPAICDFGVARRIDDATLTQEGTPIGSLIYIAPEQRRSAHAATFASDVFALGQVFYFMITGEPPQGNPPQVRTLRLNCHSAINELVERMRRHDGAERPVDGGSVVALVRACKLRVLASPEFVRVSSRWKYVELDGPFAIVRDGGYRGRTPLGAADSTWTCSSCGFNGPWDGVRCLECGRVSDPND